MQGGGYCHYGKTTTTILFCPQRVQENFAFPLPLNYVYDLTPIFEEVTGLLPIFGPTPPKLAIQIETSSKKYAELVKGGTLFMPCRPYVQG